MKISTCYRLKPCKILIAEIILFGIVGCHSPSGPNFPPAPPTPPDFIACSGHGNSYSDAGLLSNDNYPIWYAFWQQSADSTRATLIVGINPGWIDTESIARDSSGWGYFINDTIFPNPRLTVHVTPDSVIEGSFGVDAGTYYYLKKLN